MLSHTIRVLVLWASRHSDIPDNDNGRWVREERIKARSTGDSCNHPDLKANDRKEKQRNLVMQVGHSRYV